MTYYPDIVEQRPNSEEAGRRDRLLSRIRERESQSHYSFGFFDPDREEDIQALRTILRRKNATEFLEGADEDSDDELREWAAQHGSVEGEPVLYKVTHHDGKNDILDGFVYFYFEQDDALRLEHFIEKGLIPNSARTKSAYEMSIGITGNGLPGEGFRMIRDACNMLREGIEQGNIIPARPLLDQDVDNTRPMTRMQRRKFSDRLHTATVSQSLALHDLFIFSSFDPRNTNSGMAQELAGFQAVGKMKWGPTSPRQDVITALNWEIPV